MTEHSSNNSQDNSEQELNVFEMDDNALAAEAARILLYEVAGVSFMRQRHGFTPEQAIRGALKVLLSDRQPQSFRIRQYDYDDTVESSKKEAVLAELGSRIVQKWEIPNNG